MFSATVFLPQNMAILCLKGYIYKIKNITINKSGDSRETFTGFMNLLALMFVHYEKVKY